MSRVLCIPVLFTIIGACAFASAGIAKPRIVPIPAAGKHAVRRSGSDINWPDIFTVSTIPSHDYPFIIAVFGPRLMDTDLESINGIYIDEDTYNDHPVYKNRDGWSIYYRISGYAANNWVLDSNDVSEDWDGTVAYNSELLINLPSLF